MADMTTQATASAVWARLRKELDKINKKPVRRKFGPKAKGPFKGSQGMTSSSIRG